LIDAIFAWNVEIEEVQNIINKSSLYICQLHDLTNKFSNLEKMQKPKIHYTNYEYSKMIVKESVSYTFKFGSRVGGLHMRNFAINTMLRATGVVLFNLYIGWNIPTWCLGSTMNVINVGLVGSLIPIYTAERVMKKLSNW